MFRYLPLEKVSSSSKPPFWQGAVGKVALIDTHTAIIKRIMSGYTAGQMERDLIDNCYYIYIFRLNQANRFIFSTISVDGFHYLNPLEVVDEHDYQKSKYLKSGVYKQYLAKHKEAILEKIEKPSETSESSVTVEKKIIIPRVIYDHREWIALDENQSSILSDIFFPAVISGLPGVGKTTLASTILGDYLKTKAVAGDKLLFITRSSMLLNEVKKEFSELNLTKGGVQVDFLTYVDLAKKAHQGNIVGKEEALEWIKNNFLPRLSTLRKVDKQAKGKGKQNNKKKETPDLLLSKLASDIPKIYESWRAICCLKLDDSIVLNNEEKCFTDPELQKIVGAALNDHLKQLEAEQSINSELSNIPTQETYTLILVDESADFSHLELLKIASLAINRQICYFIGDNQDVYDSHSKRPFLIRELGKNGQPVYLNFLSEIYRSAENIALLGEGFIDLSDTVAGGTADKLSKFTAKASVDPKKAKGEVVWYENWDSEVIKNAKAIVAVKETEYVVVTEDKFRDEVKHLFGTRLIFTPEEIKGLGFPFVNCYRLLDRLEFKEASAILKTIPQSEYGKKTNRPRNGESNEAYRVYFHRVFTSVMRGMSTVHFYQEKQKEHHYLKNIADYLHLKVPFTIPKPPEGQKIAAAPVTTREDYEKLIKQLAASGNSKNIELAKTIFFEQKMGTLQDFIELTQPDHIVDAIKNELEETEEPPEILSEESLSITFPFPDEKIASINSIIEDVKTKIINLLDDFDKASLSMTSKPFHALLGKKRHLLGASNLLSDLRSRGYQLNDSLLFMSSKEIKQLKKCLKPFYLKEYQLDLVSLLASLHAQGSDNLEFWRAVFDRVLFDLGLQDEFKKIGFVVSYKNLPIVKSLLKYMDRFYKKVYIPFPDPNCLSMIKQLSQISKKYQSRIYALIAEKLAVSYIDQTANFFFRTLAPNNQRVFPELSSTVKGALNFDADDYFCQILDDLYYQFNQLLLDYKSTFSNTTILFQNFI